MELVIVHEHGWSITNFGDKGSEYEWVDDSDKKKGGVRRNRAEGKMVFDVVGELSLGLEVFCIYADKTGWICRISKLTEKIFEAIQVSALEEGKINKIINQIKKHHGTTR